MCGMSEGGGKGVNGWSIAMNSMIRMVEGSIYGQDLHL